MDPCASPTPSLSVPVRREGRMLEWLKTELEYLLWKLGWKD